MRGLPYFATLADDGRWQMYLDHHMISTFQSCEAKFYCKHILMIQPKYRRAAVSIGGWWARTMEDFYNAFEAKHATLEYFAERAMHHWKELDMEGLKVEDPDKFEKFGGLKGALLMCREYFDRYAREDAQRWKVISVELGFGLRGEVYLGENDKVVVYYCGKPDKLVLDLVDNVLQPVDDKSVDLIPWNIQVKYKPHNQIAGYVFAVNTIVEKLGIRDRKAERCVVNVCGRLPAGKTREGKQKERFTRVYPSYSQEELEKWRLDRLSVATRIRERCEQAFWELNDQSCHLYSGCEYRPIHSLPASKQLVAIESGYNYTEPWKPYELQFEDEKG